MDLDQLEKYKTEFLTHVKKLQDEITQAMIKLDPDLVIEEDIWTRKDYLDNDGGGGITRAFRGNLFENAGVNTSEIYGEIDPSFASKLEGSGDSLWAAGISLIIHPTNPKHPTVHANFRMIHQGDKFWFGGGADLTPYYPYPEDFQYFHKTWHKACEPYGCYEQMKKTCDEYFVNHHRSFDDGTSEMRGIGGLFFDHFNSQNLEKDFHMVKDISNYFIESYFPIIEKRLNEPYSQEDVDFQLHRRGRYVEFNLLHDRGTLFGLKTKGRIDSILISLPARCRYSYKYSPTHEKHIEMMNYYRPHEWIVS